MAVSTTPQPRRFWMTVAYLVLCLGLGLWGAYDYFVTIPAKDAAFNRYTEILARKAAIEQSTQRTEAEINEYLLIQKELDEKFVAEPEKPSTLDRAVQLWVYMIFCGVISTPYCVFALYRLTSRKHHLSDSGDLTHPDGVWKSEEIADIDMSRWMSKSIATVVHRDGRRVDLDDYKYKSMHLIVGHFAHRFHPEQWTSDARLVKKEAPAEGGSQDGGEPAESNDRGPAGNDAAG